MKKSHVTIYQTSWHLLVTILFIVVPFLFLFIFSRFAHIAAGRLFADVFISFFRLISAYIVAALLAWIFAALFYHGRRAVIALPIFDVLQSFPTFAALPLAVLTWGSSNFTVIVFLIITVIWPIFFSIISALKLVRHEWEEAIAIAGLSGSEYVKKFLWPASVPGLITGSIIGLGEGWEALVATEIIVNTPHGLGNFFQSFSRNYAITAFGILGLLLIIFSVNKLVWFPLMEWSHRQHDG